MTADQISYQYLSNLARWLHAEGVEIVQAKDGRDGSKENERIVLKAVERYVLQHPMIADNRVRFIPAEEDETRHWYDFALLISGPQGDYLAPTNIKVSTCTTADNVGSKLGLLYALSGQEPPTRSPNWPEFHRFLSDLIGVSEGADYYFLVVQKAGEDSGDVFPASLRRLRKIVPNGNNLPFQCRWSDNRNPVHRSFDEAVKFLLGGLYESHKRRAVALTSFEKLLSGRVSGHV